jgi:hypothetical protein
VVAKLFNQGKSYRAKALAFRNGSVIWLPRGAGRIMRLDDFPSAFELAIDDDMKANEVRYLPQMMSGEYEMTMDGNKAMYLQIWCGTWALLLDKTTVPVKASVYGTYDDPISPAEWTNLVNRKSKIDLDSLDYKPFIEAVWCAEPREVTASPAPLVRIP